MKGAPGLPRGRWRWALVLAAGLHAAPSAAEPPAGPSAAERTRLADLLGKGADAAKEKDWKGCVDALWDALALEDSARTAGELALCEEQAGRFGDAMNHLLRALAEATPDMKKTEPWKSYQAASARMLWQVAMVGLTVRPSDARVLVDGRPYGKADGRLLAMSHGEHTIVARAEGYEDAIEKRLVTAAGIPNIHLQLRPKVGPGAPASLLGPAAVAPEAAASITSLSPSGLPNPCSIAWSARGVLAPLTCLAVPLLVATAAVAITYEVQASSLRSALVARGFVGTSCSSGQRAEGFAECADIADRIRKRDTAMEVLIATGVVTSVLAAGAVAATVVERRGPELKAAVGPNGGGLLVQGTW